MRGPWRVLRTCQYLLCIAIYCIYTQICTVHCCYEVHVEIWQQNGVIRSAGNVPSFVFSCAARHCGMTPPVGCGFVDSDGPPRVFL